MEETVLCYLKKKDHILMLYRNKEKDDINSGKWIGVGGHIESGETKEAALIREVKEETGLDVLGFKYRGELYFKDDNYDEIMHLFISEQFEGDIKECDEGELHWIEVSKVMDLNMWEGDRVFLPLLLNSNEFIKMSLIYKSGQLVEIKR